MKIRRADQNDFHGCLHGCLDIVPRAWRSSSFDARLGEHLLRDHAWVAIEEPDDKIAGFLPCNSTSFDADGFYLRTLIVDDTLRQKGVGAQLTRKAIKWAFAAGARRVFADVGEIKHMHAEG